MSSESKSNRNMVLILIAVFSILVLLVCIFMLTNYSVSSYKESLLHSSLKEMVGDSQIELTTDLESGRTVTSSKAGGNGKILKKYKTLYELNNDVVGWITIDGTKVDYPVMQTVYDEEYYLYRNYYRKDAKEGLPFMDSRCMIGKPSTNLIIYGHNMKNGTMFADLLKYESKDYYDKHRYIRFDTLYEEAIYEIVAVFRSRVAFENEDTFRFYNFIEADYESEFYDYYEMIRNMSLYSIDAEAMASDYLLTLCTCEYTVEDGRFVIVARKIAGEEELSKDSLESKRIAGNITDQE
ncbi:MAG: class B sortase [Lachnospiraceae bacterium]|nr:class B sortase [Lachnospiraceae bacterium]